MVKGLAFHYFPGHSVLHRWDARCKFLALLAVTFNLFQADASSLIPFSIFWGILLFLSRLPWKRLYHDLKIWALFLSVIFLMNAFFSPGTQVFNLAWFPMTEEGIYKGFLVCWRLGLILGYAILFSALTRPREVRDVVTWLLKPFPFLPARRIGLMTSLTIHFLPMLMDQMSEVKLAFLTRLGDRRKNPLSKGKFMIFPLLRRSFIRADDFALALVARGYRDDLPLRLPKISLIHLVWLIVFIAILCLTNLL